MMQQLSYRRAARCSVVHQSKARVALRCAAAETSKSGRTAKEGRMTYKPASFGELVEDAARSVAFAVKDGCKAMEVEFPPVPTNLDAYKGESDMYIDSNVQLAFAGARKLVQEGYQVHILTPDQGEYNRSYGKMKASLEASPGVSLGHLREFIAGSPLTAFQNLFMTPAPDSKKAAEEASLLIVVNATAGDLPFIQEYYEQFANGRPMVLWNLELDTIRGDLGLIGYPPKDLHYKFLSGFKPVYMLRPRDYSKSVSVAPFLVNYSGALFREYPGPWQVMIKQDNSEYACIAESLSRYNLGEVKDELQAALSLNTEADGSLEQLLRRGVKTSTWWEDDYDLEEKHDWRL